MKLPLTIGAKVASAIYDADGVPVCVIDSMQEASRGEEVEMARRIVACVNACEGVPTDVLENTVQRGGALMYQQERRKAAEAQRDELLAALEKAFPELDKIDRHCLGWPFVSEPVEILRAAIARAKGGAS